jgi:hypothetical protein
MLKVPKRLMVEYERSTIHQNTGMRHKHRIGKLGHHIVEWRRSGFVQNEVVQKLGTRSRGKRQNAAA